MNSRILLIENDAALAGSLTRELEVGGYQPSLAGRADEGLAWAKQETFHAVLAAFGLPGLSGLELVDQLHVARPKLPIILMTACGTADTAIQAAKLGAFD